MFTLVSCGPATIWDIAVGDLPDLITSGNTSYLTQLDLESVNLREIVEFRPGAAYFHAFLAVDAGRPDLFPLLLETEWQYGERFWKLLAGKTLVEYLLRNGEHVRAEELSVRLMAEAPSEPSYRRQYVESLYWQKQDEEVLKQLDEFPSAERQKLEEPEFLELFVFEAVSSARLRRPGWKQKLIDLYLDQRASSFHFRVYGYIREELAHQFTHEELAFLEAVVALADGKYAEAAPVMGRLLTEEPMFYLTEATVRGTYDAYRLGGLSRDGAEVFDRLLEQEKDRSSPEEDYALHEAAALLNWKARRLNRAYQLFEDALGRARSPENAERMRWYLLNTALKVSPDRALEVLPSVMSGWLDPDYYSDVLEEIVTDLVIERRWSRILDLYIDTAGRVDPYTEARLAYLCGAAIREGFLSIEDGRRAVSGPDESDEMAEIFFGNGILEAAGRYYEIVGSAAVGVVPRSLNVVEPAPFGVEETTDAEVVAAGFLAYGLLERAHERVSDDPGAIQNQTITELAAALAKNGDYFRSIRLMDSLKNRITYLTTRQNLELLYPRAYKAIIEEASARNDIPPYVLFGLVREESRFDPDIVSHAGAVGLSQVMPATARETAVRMKIDLPDLAVPADNIAIGSYYLSRQIDRFGVISNALFAYNGGPGNMSAWRRAFAGLPQDLLAESVPFKETRNYGRKVLASAAAYGYLYYGVPPGETVRLFFSDYTRENINR